MIGGLSMRPARKSENSWSPTCRLLREIILICWELLYEDAVVAPASFLINASKRFSGLLKNMTFETAESRTMLRVWDPLARRMVIIVRPWAFVTGVGVPSSFVTKSLLWFSVNVRLS